MVAKSSIYSFKSFSTDSLEAGGGPNRLMQWWLKQCIICPYLGSFSDIYCINYSRLIKLPPNIPAPPSAPPNLLLVIPANSPSSMSCNMSENSPYGLLLYSSGLSLLPIAWPWLLPIKMLLILISWNISYLWPWCEPASGLHSRTQNCCSLSC